MLAMMEKRKVREKQKRTWYNLSGANQGSSSPISLSKAKDLPSREVTVTKAKDLSAKKK